MAKGGYIGGNTQFGPRNPSWFGKGNPTAGAPAPARQPVPMTAAVEQQIAQCRKHVRALETRIASDEAALRDEKARLKALLLRYDQPLDKGL